MKIKKFIPITIGLLLAGAILFLIFRFLVVGSSSPANGTYKIVDNENHSEALLIINGDSLQFKNIDLNSIFRESQVQLYDYLSASGTVVPLSKEELEKKSDLNETFVTNPYTITEKPIKIGTFTYRYVLVDEIYLFGLIIEYDAFHKSIEAYMSSGEVLNFKR